MLFPLRAVIDAATPVNRGLGFEIVDNLNERDKICTEYCLCPLLKEKRHAVRHTISSSCGS